MNLLFIYFLKRDPTFQKLNDSFPTVQFHETNKTIFFKVKLQLKNTRIKKKVSLFKVKKKKLISFWHAHIVIIIRRVRDTFSILISLIQYRYRYTTKQLSLSQIMSVQRESTLIKIDSKLKVFGELEFDEKGRSPGNGLRLKIILLIELFLLFGHYIKY